MDLNRRQEAMIREINSLGDCLEQYTYLIVQASRLPPLPEDRRRDEDLIRGCQSKVWLKAGVLDGIFFMEADSDTLILRGVLAILSELLNGAPASEVAQTELTILSRTELSASFTSDRNTGMRSILDEIRRAASPKFLQRAEAKKDQ